MLVSQITSPANPRVKHVIALNDRKQRERERLMLVEGYDPLAMAVACGLAPKTLFVCQPMLKVPHAEFLRLRNACAKLGAEVVDVSDKAFERMAYRDGPDGWLAIVSKPDYPLSRLDPGPNALLLVAERVEKPGNLGAMLRTCDAAGVDAFISCDPIADLSNPNVVRASQGALFSVPIAEGPTADVIDWLRSRGIAILATTPNPVQGGEPSSIFDVPLAGPIAIVVGEEKEGLSAAWFRAADRAAKIPMFGKINSLNVSISAAVCVYEAVKQRRAASAQ